MGMHITGGLAKFGQKQYPSTLVRYWALVRAEVFQFSFLFLSSSSVTILGSGSGQTIFKFPNFAKPYPIALVLGISSFSFGQSKTVKLVIDSTKIYFRYFYNSKNVSDETLNNSVRIVGRKITEDKFYLDKFINKQKIWTRIYRIELAKDSLHVTTRSGYNNGKHKFEYSKELYYKTLIIEN